MSVTIGREDGGGKKGKKEVWTGWKDVGKERRVQKKTKETGNSENIRYQND